jgi:hypothetical protein
MLSAEEQVWPRRVLPDGRFSGDLAYPPDLFGPAPRLHDPREEEENQVVVVAEKRKPSSNYFFIDKHGDPTLQASGASLYVFSIIIFTFSIR